MPKATKKHIADKALELFNTTGFANVRLQHIADAAFVSVGHLAYHFKTKNAIAEFLCRELMKKQLTLLNEFRVVPTFEEVQRYLQATYKLQVEYPFFYLDALELFRAIPELQKTYKEQLSFRGIQLGLMIEYNIAGGALEPASPEAIKQIASNLTLMMEGWNHTAQCTGIYDISEMQFVKSIWGYLSPFCTEIGRNELGYLSVA